MIVMLHLAWLAKKRKKTWLTNENKYTKTAEDGDCEYSACSMSMSVSRPNTVPVFNLNAIRRWIIDKCYLPVVTNICSCCIHMHLLTKKRRRRRIRRRNTLILHSSQAANAASIIPYLRAGSRLRRLLFINTVASSLSFWKDENSNFQ